MNLNLAFLLLFLVPTRGVNAQCVAAGGGGGAAISYNGTIAALWGDAGACVVCVHVCARAFAPLIQSQTNDK